MVGEHPTQTTLPGNDLKPAWRAACIAYRKVRQAGQLDQPAWLAARAAVLEVRPDIVIHRPFLAKDLPGASGLEVQLCR